MLSQALLVLVAAPGKSQSHSHLFLRPLVCPQTPLYQAFKNGADFLAVLGLWSGGRSSSPESSRVFTPQHWETNSFKLQYQTSLPLKVLWPPPPPRCWWFSIGDMARPSSPVPLLFLSHLLEHSLVLSPCSFKPERWWEGARWEQKKDTCLSK